MIDLYYGSGSPYAWRVWFALEHKALPYELHVMSFSAGDLKTDAYRAINPRGLVPAIVDGDFRLAESAAILEYLQDAYPDAGAPLFPAEVHARAQARRTIREADEYLAHRMEALLDLVFGPSETPDERAIENAREQLLAELSVLEAGAGEPFLAGSLGAVDFTVYPMLALTLRMQDRKRPQLRIRESLGPRITAWMRRVEALPCFERTYPPHWKSVEPPRPGA
jgi:glutathione S-transferase